MIQGDPDPPAKGTGGVGLPRVLVVCASDYNRRGMSRPGVLRVCEPVFHDYDDRFHRSLIEREQPDPSFYDPERLIEQVVGLARSSGAQGLTVTQDYPGALIAAAAAARLGLAGPSIDAVLACQHKHLSRRLQRHVVPEATPRFARLPRARRHPPGWLPMPLFAKPIRSNYSFGARRVDSCAGLAGHRDRMKLPDSYLRPMRWALAGSRHRVRGDPGDMLLEEAIEGHQVTLEGIASGGEVHVVGVVDSHFFPGTIAFERFVYPSVVPADLQESMLAIARRFIQAIGFDDGLFNMEFIADLSSGALRIIEVNPRMCSQFADMMEKVDGINTYEHAVRVALRRPPRLVRGAGRYRIAASFPLRTFENRLTLRAPTPGEIEQMERAVPGVEGYVWTKPGARLSDLFQDGESFCYGRLNVGARDGQELEEKRRACLRLLPFAFAPATGR